MPLARRCFAELVGTFILIAGGCGAVLVNQMPPAASQPGALGLVGIALVWGLLVMSLASALGDLSGCHINPAVTVGFAVARRFPWKEVLPYIAAQVVGAFAAILFLKVLFPTSDKLAATTPDSGLWQSFAVEVFLTWVLMLAILGVSSGAKEKGVTAALVVGGVIALEVLVGGPLTGASMNPARSLAPAVVSGKVETVWVYLLAPTLGAALAVPTYQLLKPVPPSPKKESHRDRG